MKLLEPLQLRGTVLPHRLGMPPMTLYCAQAGMPTEWHLVHYGSRAYGVGLIVVEATAVTPAARVTLGDLGIWSNEHADALGKIARFVHDQGAVCGIQLSHGGRKASRTRPWEGDKRLDVADGGWTIFAPSAKPFANGQAVPRELDERAIERIIEDFVMAAKRAVDAGFRFIEIHAGHGRLFHNFYSPLANLREDKFGGSFENRTRFLITLIRTIREQLGDYIPLGVRLSCVDWAPGGWTLADSVRLACLLKAEGCDIIDCTSGVIVREPNKPLCEGYQVPFAIEIRARSGICTAAVGLLRDPTTIHDVLESGAADLALLGRSLLMNPHFALDLIRSANGSTKTYPLPYERAAKSASSLEEFSSTHIPEL